MGYSDKELSRQDSAPVMLYLFTRGSSTWRYVPLPIDFVALGHTWTSCIGLLGNIVSSGDIPKDAVNVTLPITNPMVAGFLGYAPDEITTVTIWRTHYDDPTNGSVVWKGRVMRFGDTVSTVALTCEPVFSSLRRLGLAPTYQRTCIHDLGRRGCNVDMDPFASVIEVTAVVGAKVTVGTLGSSYVGGTLKAADGTIRMIVDQDATTLTLMRPILSLSQSMIANPGGFFVTIYPGCDHSTTMCAAKYNNIGNFGGFPGIRYINPMSNESSVF